MQARSYLILAFLLSAGQSYCEQTVNADFVRSLNNSMNQAVAGNNTHEGILLFPGAYYSKKHKTYAGLGFMIDSVEILQKIEGEEEEEEGKYVLNQTAALMRLAFYIRRKKTNLTLLFDYHKDKSWGISFKLKL